MRKKFGAQRVLEPIENPKTWSERLQNALIDFNPGASDAIIKAATITGVHTNTINRWLSEPERDPGFRSILQLCAAINADPYFIAFGTKSLRPPGANQAGEVGGSPSDRIAALTRALGGIEEALKALDKRTLENKRLADQALREVRKGHRRGRA